MDLRDRHEFLTRLTGSALWEYDIGTGRVVGDAELLRRLGLDPDKQLTCERWLALVHPSDRERLILGARRFLASPHLWRTDQRSLIRLRGTGHYSWFNVAFTVHPEGSGVLVAAVTDATVELRERFVERCSDKVYRDVWQSIPSCAVVLDVTGRIVEANPAWYESAQAGGGPRSAYVGDSYIDAVHRAVASGDDSALPVLEGIQRVLTSREKRFACDYACAIPGGETRWFRMNVYALIRPTRGAVVFHSDITTPRAVDLALQRERDRLVHMHRLSTMNELAASIAHELNQPLATIAACACTARRLADAESPAELRPIMEDIREAAMRAAQVVRGARAMVRRNPAERESLDVNEVVQAVARLVTSDLLIHQIALTLNLAEHLPVIVGDRIQLQQVVLNLLLNSIDAVSDQPCARRQIHISSIRTDQHVELVVADTGKGVPPEILARLFDPFMTTKRDGMGLGLAIVRAVVEAHGGRVTAFTPAEGGAAFRVSLPANAYEEIEDSNHDFALSSVFTPVAAGHR
jgi:two-component system sensor kinase FixL